MAYVYPSFAFPVVARAIITMAARTELGMVCHASIRSLMGQFLNPLARKEQRNVYLG